MDNTGKTKTDDDESEKKHYQYILSAFQAVPFVRRFKKLASHPEIPYTEYPRLILSYKEHLCSTSINSTIPSLSYISAFS